ncbi:MAG TPA: DUF2085 domain-containing protein [Anaerolineae bacterium]|nr:DUF2085 domain-containing protein [Anaerolineae bacterium]HIP73653.1 DUF2085 domain-containing protein [Anaerolineae bacterium]
MNSTPPNETVNGRTQTLANSINRAAAGFNNHWLAVINILVATYILLPLLAPTLMKTGLETPARVIYTMYSPMCHQMASRSFFLFGEQPVYPRELAGTNYTPLEAYTPDLPEFADAPPENWARFFLAARRFVGNEQMGYKTALCERDLAIYGFVLAGGLVYALLRKRYRIRPLPIILFIIIGMGPIALDGFSQLFGYYAVPLDGSAPQGFQATIAAIFPLRESPPSLRILTGALFGFMLAWLIFPHIEAGMQPNKKVRK